MPRALYDDERADNMADGRLVDEIPREGNESSRSYTGTGENGHLPLPEARRWSLERVESMESEVADALATVKETATALRLAQEDHDKAEADLHRLRVQLAAARRDLSWRLGLAPLREAPDGT